MSNILKKEIKLSASILSFLFIAFGLMFFLPGYPVLCGPFFICLGIFQSFQNAREANDIVFSALLPISKKDVVKGKFQFVCFIELCGIFIMAVATLIRMTILSESLVYRQNALMNANFFALATAFVVFGLFNFVFVRGFFKTAYKYGRPFVYFIIVTFVIIAIAESIHYIPGCQAINAFGFDYISTQITLLAGGIIAFILLTIVSLKKAWDSFEKIDL